MNYTIDNFLSDAYKIHGNKYIYSKVIYKNSQTKVCIICPIHGEFWMTPNKHLLGQGCPKCSGKYKTTEDLIKEFKTIHGDNYDYSQVKYKRAIDKVCIICHKKDKYGNEHGEFWQTPNKHLQGRGCPHCQNSHLENTIKAVLSKENINFVFQQEFDWLIYNQKIKLDFYLPDYNIAIECQGEQHFRPVFPRNDLKKASEIFEKTHKRDVAKYNLCKEHNINLLYFSNLNKEKIFLNEMVFHKIDELLKEIKK